MSMSPSKAKRPGGSGYVSRHQSQVTFGLRLIDTYTGVVPIDSQIQVSSQQIYKRPIMKANGDMVFSGLDVLPSYELEITSKFYVNMLVTVSLAELEADYPVQQVVLYPNPSYPFHSSATLIRGAVQDKLGERFGSASIVAQPISEGTHKARLAQSIASDDVWLQLTEFAGPIHVGDELELRQDVKEPGEIRRIVSASDENHRTFRIHEPVSNSYARGTNVFPVYRAVSDAMGEWVMPIRDSCPEVFALELQVEGRKLTQPMMVNGTAGGTLQVKCVVL